MNTTITQWYFQQSRSSYLKTSSDLFCPPISTPLVSVSTLSLLCFVYLLSFGLSTLCLVSPMVMQFLRSPTLTRAQHTRTTVSWTFNWYIEVWTMKMNILETLHYVLGSVFKHQCTILEWRILLFPSIIFLLSIENIVKFSIWNFLETLLNSPTLPNVVLGTEMLMILTSGSAQQPTSNTQTWH